MLNHVSSDIRKFSVKKNHLFLLRTSKHLLPRTAAAALAPQKPGATVAAMVVVAVVRAPAANTLAVWSSLT